MLDIITQCGRKALTNPRLDMPRGEVFAISGQHRNIYPVRIPKKLAKITAEQVSGGEVAVRWGLTVRTWGLAVDIYRGDQADFEISEKTKIARTELGAFFDRSELPAGNHYYAVVFDNTEKRTEPIRVSVKVSRAGK